METTMMPKRTITQAMLQDLRDARDEASDAEERARRLRREILTLHREGADREPGELDFAVIDRTRTVFTQAKIEAVLGKAAANQLVNAIGPTTVTYVKVTKSAAPLAMDDDPGDDDEFHGNRANGRLQAVRDDGHDVHAKPV
jgi:Spy/CpxP family protein refolding chaperone